MTVIRQRNYSIRTETAYRSWVERFLTFIHRRNPRTAGVADVVSFLETLAVQGHVAASTQNQALNALLFFYAYALEQPLGDFVRAKRPSRVVAAWSVPWTRSDCHSVAGLWQNGYRR
ncbi:MAG: hypothetical protein QG599_793 [Pseudomonadota bacterium]|nr:hypothetical protein [Pseudomonadota bacterium]